MTVIDPWTNRVKLTSAALCCSIVSLLILTGAPVNGLVLLLLLAAGALAWSAK